MPLSKALLSRRLALARALVLDVDGVMTDGGMYYGPAGEVLKKFNTRDGMGIRLVREAGLHVAFITGEETEIVRARARKLKVRHVYTGVERKGVELDSFLKRVRVEASRVVYVGDDLNDLPALRKAGIPVAVADAAPAVLKAACWVTRRAGGAGAVREVCDALLAARRH